LIATSVEFFAADSGRGIIGNSDFKLWNDLFVRPERGYLIANYNGLDGSCRRWRSEPMRVVRDCLSEMIAVEKHASRISYDPFR
jgi:hypothetical protein